ncbi:MAG: DNA/RNA nuclease SfsA [Candidatus Brocadia sp.]|nr:DNA/RNA nuclease SfsA [Candidatus Brocadia sp.]
MIEIYRYNALQSGVFLRRYKRFLVDVELPDRRIVTAFCPNSGSMKGCSDTGTSVMLSYHEFSKRKTLYTLEMVKADGMWVGVNTLLTNDLAHRLIELKLIHELSPYKVIKREATFGNSRLDFLLSNGKRECFVEVKNVTLKDGHAAKFPDAVTVRGRKHLNSLMNAIEMGYNACMLYIVQRSDCDCFAPAEEIDPEYVKTLKVAMMTGVKVFAFKFDIRPEGIYFLERLPLHNSILPDQKNHS